MCRFSVAYPIWGVCHCWYTLLMYQCKGVPGFEPRTEGRFFFLVGLWLNRPTNVIRHMSILGNMMSSPRRLPPSFTARCSTRFANPFLDIPIDFYTPDMKL